MPSFMSFFYPAHGQLPLGSFLDLLLYATTKNILDSLLLSSTIYCSYNYNLDKVLLLLSLHCFSREAPQYILQLFGLSNKYSHTCFIYMHTYGSWVIEMTCTICAASLLPTVGTAWAVSYTTGDQLFYFIGFKSQATVSPLLFHSSSSTNNDLKLYGLSWCKQQYNHNATCHTKK